MARHLQRARERVESDASVVLRQRTKEEKVEDQRGPAHRVEPRRLDGGQPLELELEPARRRDVEDAVQRLSDFHRRDTPDLTSETPEEPAVPADIEALEEHPVADHGESVVDEA